MPLLKKNIKSNATNEVQRKPILCLDFDGVCHSYASGWKGATVIPDDAVPGLKAGVLNTGLFTSESNEWETPPNIFSWLDKEFAFTLDPCCTPANAKCQKHFTKAENGLAQEWSYDTVYMNPPYGREIGAWMEKAAKESLFTTIVCLVPARTDTNWFHKFVTQADEVRFVKGRLKFEASANSAPFPSMIVIFRPFLERQFAVTKMYAVEQP